MKEKTFKILFFISFFCLSFKNSGPINVDLVNIIKNALQLLTAKKGQNGIFDC